MKTLIAFLLLCSTAVAQSPFVSTSTVREDGSGCRGSGVCYRVYDYGVDGGPHMMILTHAHNRKLKDEVQVRFSNNAEHDGHIVAIDNDRDLSIIACKEYPSRAFVQIMPAKESVAVGAEVRMVGFGFSKDGNRDVRIPVDKHTTITDAKAMFKDCKYPLIRTAGDARPGDSGGALLYKNRLVGITRLMTTGDGTNHDAGFVRHTEIWEFLEAVHLKPYHDTNP